VLVHAVAFLEDDDGQQNVKEELLWKLVWALGAEESATWTFSCLRMKV
jgi:hypothetical protein